jgi:tyrosyl-DNA phosphodiesterase-1
LDPDVRDLVQVKIVHGSWKAEDTQRIRLEESAKRYLNVQILKAHMPEAFGTHHTKMMVLIRHDDTAQIVIHTANMISQDWVNLTQAVWRSPILPLLKDPPSSENPIPTGPIGTGDRFKFDFLRYLKAYSGRTKSLVERLRQYDFASIRAALIASTPSRTNISTNSSTKQTSWGWPGLKEILSTVPYQQEDISNQPNIIAQVSSIATLTEKWLVNFIEVVSTKGGPRSGSFFGSKPKKPKFQVIFPIAEEIRQSLDGYASGSSIHMKLQSVAQQKQLIIMKPMFCYWMGDTIKEQEHVPRDMDHIGRPLNSIEKGEPILPKREALRRRAAPHIKTYARFSDLEQKSIQWAMVTSANLSQQAWGALPDKDGLVRVCSYELGVFIWPDLFREEAGEEVKMVPTFGKDAPDLDEETEISHEHGKVRAKQTQVKTTTVVGFRMPYDLPLVPYKADDLPWCATSSYDTPDAFGRGWDGFEPR